MSSRAIRKASCVLVRPRVIRNASALRTSYLLLYVLRWNLTSVWSEKVAKATRVLSNENSRPCTTCLMKFRTRLYVSSTLPEKSNRKTTSSRREHPEITNVSYLQRSSRNQAIASHKWPWYYRCFPFQIKFHWRIYGEASTQPPNPPPPPWIKTFSSLCNFPEILQNRT